MNPTQQLVVVTGLVGLLALCAQAWPRDRQTGLGWNYEPLPAAPASVGGELGGSRATRGDPIAAPLWFLQSGKGKRDPPVWILRNSRSVAEEKSQGQY